MRLTAWMDRRAGRVSLGVVLGACTGATIFWASSLSGLNLFLLTGAAAGGVAGLVVYGYRRNFELSAVTIMVPQVSEISFVLTPDSRLTAWKLFVETSTRVSTQPLADDAGDLREALTSLYSLFQVTRATLKEVQPGRSPVSGPTVEQLCMTMLNNELRPFLSYWHPRLRGWEEIGRDVELKWSGEAEFRSELRDLQKRLEQYTAGFAALAGAQNVHSLLRREPPIRA